MESRGPTFVTGEIDVLNVVRALDHCIPLLIGHLLSISEQANERMLQHCKANRKEFALARTANTKGKAPAQDDNPNPASTSKPIRLGLIQKDYHFLRSKAISWKSAECDINVWGIPYNAIIDSGASVLAILQRVVERAGRRKNLIMLTERDHLVSTDEEKIKTVGRMTNVAFRLGKVHALGDVVVLDVSTYDVLLGLPVLTALRANLDFEKRSIVLRNTGGKPYAIPMRLTLRTVAEATQKTPPVPGGALRMIAWKKLAERSDHQTEEPNLSSDTNNSDEDGLVIWELVQQRVRYPIRQATTKTSKLTEGNIQRTRALISGEPLMQISRMADSLEPPRTLYEGTTPLLARFRDKRAFCDITELPCSLLTSRKEIRLLRLGAEGKALEPPARRDTGPHDLGIKILKNNVRWQDVCDGITPEKHVAIREEDAQMMATVKFDIRHGFHHILVKEEDRPKTAFVLFEGTCQWVRCPMGICNAPATFQRAMNVTFQNFVNKTRLTQGMISFCVIVYMDDILVYSESFHGHAQHIKWTLGALRDAGFKIALEKSEFFLYEISFLGYVVTRGGLRPNWRKVAVIRDAPTPTSLTQRAFLGLASYYRRFIKGFAAIARPLTNLLRKDQPLSWDAECEQAFSTLKGALATAPILIPPDLAKQFILITDWQPEAISAILVQKGNDGREHVIEYTSRTVSDERRNDSAPQGEWYTVVWGLQHFHFHAQQPSQGVSLPMWTPCISPPASATAFPYAQDASVELVRHGGHLTGLLEWEKLGDRGICAAGDPVMDAVAEHANSDTQQGRNQAWTAEFPLRSEANDGVQSCMQGAISEPLAGALAAGTATVAAIAVPSVRVVPAVHVLPPTGAVAVGGVVGAARALEGGALTRGCGVPGVEDLAAGCALTGGGSRPAAEAVAVGGVAPPCGNVAAAEAMPGVAAPPAAASAGTAGGAVPSPARVDKQNTEDVPAKRATSSRWGEDETVVFLQAKSEQLAARALDSEVKGNGKDPTKVWEEIKADVRRANWNRSAIECKRRWNTVKRWYSRVVDNDTRSGRQSYWTMTPKERAAANLYFNLRKNWFDILESYNVRNRVPGSRRRSGGGGSSGACRGSGTMVEEEKRRMRRGQHRITRVVAGGVPLVNVPTSHQLLVLLLPTDAGPM
ncbi:hypothetical protein CBR_g41004 [Chara braunii]|uniref:Myb-like domain-containing protein n=1 Tax=Chara braunii TaxID=69332 RepID=A0A388LV17_CHABU|nr:hypothetical protein CBR_g41004 [Chara braunii]|eukprot:GBG86101.1 hypothetical protein CBR_g41004 [Chara braunii]